MSKPRYCLKCGEAVGEESYVKDLDRSGHYTMTGFVVCYNEKCDYYGLAAALSSETKPRLQQRSAPKPRKQEKGI